MATIPGSATGSNAGRVNVWIDWWEDSFDYTNNGSIVHARFYAQTKSDQSSTTRDGQGHSHFYVNGGLATDRTGLIDFRSESPYYRPLNLLGSWDGWIGRDGNGNASISFSGDFSLSSSYISGGSAGGTVGLATIWTGAAAPSNPRFDQNPYENTLTFRWDAGAGGVNNAITTYHLYYRLNGGGENGVDVGNTTAWAADTSGWGRGTVVDFHVYAITQKSDNPGCGWSGQTVKNRVPNTPTSISLSKAFFVPGETVRVFFANNGDLDGNIRGFQAALEQDETIRGSNDSASASYVDVSTAGWTPGVYYRLRVRGYDTYWVAGGWSAYSPYFMLGLPMKAVPAGGQAPKTVASMKIVAQGSTARNVVGMKIAATQGPINRTVF